MPPRAGRCATAAMTADRHRAAAALVRARAPRPAVAAHPRPLRDPGLRGDAPADAGRAGGAALRGVARALAHRRRARGGGAAGRAARMGGPRLQPPRRAAVGGGAGGGARRLAGTPAGPAGRRALHRRGARLVRVRPPGGRAGHQRAAAVRPAGGPRCAAARAARADFNQATMELGATVCTARAPRCGACPLHAGCDGPEPPAPRGRGAAGVSRTPTDGCAAAWWRRWRPGRGCRAASRPTAWHPALQGLLRDGLIRQVADGYALG